MLRIARPRLPSHSFVGAWIESDFVGVQYPLVSLSLLLRARAGVIGRSIAARTAGCVVLRWSTEITRPCMEESYFAYPFFIMSALPLSVALSRLGTSRLGRFPLSVVLRSITV